MSDRMHPIPFQNLMTWITTEYERERSVFGCRKQYTALDEERVEFDGKKLETAVGPAAGPHTQLAQNIIASYFCGARIFELKTVQILDGEDLHVDKPCILAEDEGYNCEWSTELTVQQAFDEYVKAWFAIHYLAVELGLGSMEGFAFNMSVGYDLEGIKSKKIDAFIEGLKNAENTSVFKACKKTLYEMLPGCKTMTAEDIEAISPKICKSITLSTMHGCPANEIEKIAAYLLEEKELNLFLKCNPTLLGYDYVRNTFDQLGFTYIQFTQEQFEEDLQYEDAVPMLARLRDKAEKTGKVFGVKLTNTFPVKIQREELPGETMYMSGRTLLPLSLEVAARLSEEFHGTLPLSYCGGADAKNIAQIFKTGISPITVCTDLLKPGGYGRLWDMAKALEGLAKESPETSNTEKIRELGKTLCKEAGKGKTIRRKLSVDCSKQSINCKKVCGNCASLCPNRANIVICQEGEKQMLHIDGMCNECGNCASFCPEKTAPYLDKLTVFNSRESLLTSKNQGFARISKGVYTLRWKGEIQEMISVENPFFPEELRSMVQLLEKEYSYLLY